MSTNPEYVDRPDWWQSLGARQQEDSRQRDWRVRVEQMLHQQQQRAAAEAAQAQMPRLPAYRNGTNATLETDGIVVESGDVRIVVRGELLEKLGVLVTMAKMAKLIGADDETP